MFYCLCTLSRINYFNLVMSLKVNIHILYGYLTFIGELSYIIVFFFLMIRRPPRSTLDRSSAASDVYKRQVVIGEADVAAIPRHVNVLDLVVDRHAVERGVALDLSLIHISEPTRPY